MVKGEVLNIAREYADMVRGSIDTKTIYLYGSYAKGTANKDSDIDIAVVVDGVTGDYLALISKLWRMTQNVDDAIEPVLVPLEDKSGFLRTIRDSGIEI